MRAPDLACPHHIITPSFCSVLCDARRHACPYILVRRALEALAMSQRSSKCTALCQTIPEPLMHGERGCVMRLFQGCWRVRTRAWAWVTNSCGTVSARARSCTWSMAPHRTRWATTGPFALSWRSSTPGWRPSRRSAPPWHARFVGLACFVIYYTCKPLPHQLTAQLQHALSWLLLVLLSAPPLLASAPAA